MRFDSFGVDRETKNSNCSCIYAHFSHIFMCLRLGFVYVGNCYLGIDLVEVCVNMAICLIIYVFFFYFFLFLFFFYFLGLRFTEFVDFLGLCSFLFIK